MKLIKTPLKLLDFYTEKDEAIFPGREEEINEILGLVNETFSKKENTHANVIALTGESGTGKTSLIRAGLIPKINDAKIIYFRVGSDSPSSLIKMLEDVEFPSDKKLEIDESSSIGEKFVKLLFKKAQDAANSKGKFILILDQFEDWLARMNDGADLFPVECIKSIQDSNNAILVFIFRSDWLPEFLNWLKGLSLLIKSDRFYYLRKFNIKNAITAINSIISHDKKNLGEKKSTYEEISIDIANIIASLDERGEIYPPYIQITCAKMLKEKYSWDINREFEDKKADIQHMLSNFFEKEIFKALNQQDKRIARDLLDYLVGREGLRRKMTAEELSQSIQVPQQKIVEILDYLIDKRIIRHLDDGRYELIHDFLSAHFFSAFTREKKRLLRLNDIFRSAMQDYRDEGILLNYERMTLFLAFKDKLNLTPEKERFLIESMVKNCGMCNFMVTSDMKPTILSIVSDDSEGIYYNISLKMLSFLIRTDEVPVLKEIMIDENRGLSPRWIAAESINNIDPRFLKVYLQENLFKLGVLSESSSEYSFLLSLMNYVNYILDDIYIEDLCKFLINSKSEILISNIISYISKFEIIRGIETMLDLLNQDYDIIPRYASSFLTIIVNFFLFNETYVEQFKDKLSRLFSIYEEVDDEVIIYDLYMLKFKLFPITQEDFEKTVGKIKSWTIRNMIIDNVVNRKDIKERWPIDFLITKLESEKENVSTAFLFQKLLDKIKDGTIPKDDEGNEILNKIFNKTINLSNISQKPGILLELTSPEINHQQTINYLLDLNVDSADSFQSINILLDVYSRKGNEKHIRNIANILKSKNWEIDITGILFYLKKFGERYPDEIKKILNECLAIEVDEFKKISIMITLMALGDQNGLEQLLSYFNIFQTTTASKIRFDLNYFYYIKEILFGFVDNFADLKPKFKEIIAGKLKNFIQTTPLNYLKYIILRQIEGIEDYFDNKWLNSLYNNSNSILIRTGALLSLSRKSRKSDREELYFYIDQFHNSVYYMIQETTIFALGNLRLKDDQLHEERRNFFLSLIKNKDYSIDRRSSAIHSYFLAYKEGDSEQLNELVPSLPCWLQSTIKDLLETREKSVDGAEFRKKLLRFPSNLIN